MSEPLKGSKEESGLPAVHAPVLTKDHQSTISQKACHPDTTTMAPVVRKRRQPLTKMLLIAALVAAVLFFLFIESDSELQIATSPGLASQHSKSKDTQKFNVNAPPVQKGFWGPSHNDADSHRNSFMFWGQQSNRLATDSHPKHLKKKGQKKNKKRETFQIILDDDDRVPQAVPGSVIHASDALLCRESVIDYVINATDLKDECDGLKSAYSKTCVGEGEAAQGSRRRRLEEGARDPVIRQDNPILRWRYRIHTLTNTIRAWWRGRPDILMVEDEIVNDWDNAMYEVQNGWDVLLREDFPEFKGRRLAETAQLNNASKSSVGKGIGVGSPATNRTEQASKDKSKMSLALPTKHHHVSENYVTETLMLQHEGQVMASVKAAHNQTNATVDAAVTDAAASVKAVSDSAAIVSEVLNDPTSVEARTCCASILNVFHENCSVDDEEELSDRRLFIIVAVMALCGLVKSLVRHFQIRWLPEAAGCILVGVVSGWALSYFPHHDLSFDGPWFLRIMVPPIIFEAALSIDKQSFQRHVVPIMFYAVAGTLFATTLTAFLVHKGSMYLQGYCETIPVIESLTFGALISSIDPIAVLSVLSNMGMSQTDTIYVVIFGESLLNDGVAIVLFQTLVHFLDANMEVDSHAVLAATIHFFVVFIGSLLIGVASGICCNLYYWLMYGCHTPVVEVLTFCCWALLPYYICDGIEWSGIVAVVATGFVMDITVVGQKPAEDWPQSARSEQATSPRGRRERKRRAIFSPEGHLSGEARSRVGFVTEIVSTTMETAIFAYLGLFLFSSRYHWNYYHTLVAILACIISRAIMIPCLSTLANWVTKIQQFRASWRHHQLPQQESQATPLKQSNPAGVIIDRKMQLVLWFAGLRGAMSFALVENIPLYDAVTGEGTRLKSELKAMTSASIIFTVFVMGGLTYYMMDGLGLAPQQNSAQRTAKEQLMKADRDDGVGDYGEEETAGMPNPVSPQASSSSNLFRQRVQSN